MASHMCVLCFLASIKVSDRHLVGNKGEFSVKCEIDDLDFVVHSSSQHICCVCLGILKQMEEGGVSPLKYFYGLNSVFIKTIYLKISIN